MAKFPIIILHGWGLRGSTYQKLAELLRQRSYRVYAPDLPGFGSEPLAKQSMNLDDYVLFVQSFLKKKRVKPVILIGHSFGGRVAIKYAYTYPKEVAKLILTGVPLVRDRSLRRKVATLAAVIGGTLLRNSPKPIREFFRKVLYFAIGELDYYKAGPLRQVFKNVVAEELAGTLKNVSVPVLLVWGEKDRMTPLPHLRRIKKIIPHIPLCIVPNSAHKLPHEHSALFVSKIEAFL